MTTIELQQWRESFIERYLNKIDDMETVLKIEKYMKRIMSKANAESPISFSLKEANREIDIAEQELEEGKGINEDDMHQFFETWRNKLK